ncbi:MAG: sigma-54 interaction domain-containing protein [Desulfobulbus sp.]
MEPLPMMDDMTFFHQATMKICGSLDEHRMIRECDDFLRQFLPSDGTMLSTYEPQRGAIRILASSSTLPLPREGQSIFLSPEAQAFIEKEGTSGSRIYPKTLQNSASREIGRALGLSNFSSLVLHLLIDQERLGVVQVFSLGEKEFSSEHARLVGLLHDPFAVALANVLRHREVIRLKDLLADDNRYLRQELRHISGDEIVGARYGLRDVMESVRQVAPMTCHVMLTGETGVGKEVIANAVHYSSPRNDGPFIKVNCGAFTENLLDSELFGHEKGAFTGAVKSKRGRFERAHKGTLFLDEVGELTPAAQVRLLRVLQDGRVERVGSVESIEVDVRIIAATHRNLAEMVKKGTFREDLWFRLNVFPIHIPPLRQRTSDIPALVHHFIDRKLRTVNLSEHPVIAPGAMEQLSAYGWPGNVRELENMVERALIRYQSQEKGKPLVFSGLSGNSPEVAAGTVQAGEPVRHLNLDEVMRRHIRAVLRSTGGKIQGRDGAAAILGIHANTLRSRMRKLGMTFGRKAGASTTD